MNVDILDLTVGDVESHLGRLDREFDQPTIIISSVALSYVARALESRTVETLDDAAEQAEAAFQDWLVTNKALISAFKKYRSYITIHIIDGLNHETSYPEAIDAYLTDAQHTQAINPFTLLMADAVLTANHEIRDTQSWLTACSTPISERSVCTDINLELRIRSLLALKQRLSSKKLKLESLEPEHLSAVNEIAQLKEENELLLLQLQQVQEELEAQFFQLTLHQEQAAQAKTNRTVEQTNHSDTIQDLKDENELLLLQLQQVQEELEHYFVRCKSLEETAQPTPSAPTKEFEKRASNKSKSRIGIFKQIIWHVKAYREAYVIRRSNLFNEAWYRDKYADLSEFKKSAALHYAVYGFKQGRDPGPQFSTSKYYMLYPEVARVDMNPLVHYELYGRKSGYTY